jgi:1-acyl-sn-glycerol-3-phosphate acyltransferase
VSNGSAEREALVRAGDTRHPAFLAVARRYAGWRVAHGLDGLWVSGLRETRTALAERPLLFASNHVAWWDSLLLVVLDEALGGSGWAVMDARNLRKLRFLGWLGALPLDRSSPERSRECLRRVAALLDRPGRSVWIFPQGRQRPAHLRPLDLKHGVQTMHEHNPVGVIAVSIGYVFLERDRPAAMVRFSEPVEAGGHDLLPAVEAAMLDGLDRIDAAARDATDGARARTDPRDPLPGFTALRRPARLRLPGRGGPDAG